MTAADVDRKIADAIDRSGWSVVGVFEDRERMAPGFSYTVGFWETFKFPEVIAFGLPPAVAQQIFNTLGTRIRDGEEIPLGQRLGQLVAQLDVVLEEIDEAAASDYMFKAEERYGGWTFRAAQLIWPDRDNRMPWDEGFDDQLRMAQPRLNDPHGTASHPGRKSGH